jgi:hypothetical protein
MVVSEDQRCARALVSESLYYLRDETKDQRRSGFERVGVLKERAVHHPVTEREDVRHQVVEVDLACYRLAEHLGKTAVGRRSRINV